MKNNNILTMAMGMMHQITLGTNYTQVNEQASDSPNPLAWRKFSRFTNYERPHQGAQECARRLKQDA